MWYTLTQVHPAESDEIEAEAVIPADSPWFSGHFPGDPILPGIAQLSMALETLRAASASEIKITGIKRIRFKQIIRPDDRVRVFIRPDKRAGEPFWTFRILIGDEIACSGTLIAESSSTSNE